MILVDITIVIKGVIKVQIKKKGLPGKIVRFRVFLWEQCFDKIGSKNVLPANLTVLTGEIR